MSQDVVADALNQIMNAQRAKKGKVELKHQSRLLLSVLAIAKLKGYVKHYETQDKILKVEIGNISGCNAIKPRHTVTTEEIEKYVKRLLPAKNIGILIISTSQGLMTHLTALDKNIGGCLIAYFY